MTGNNPLLEAALDLAITDKVPVFPCRPDKKPLTKNGFKNATCNADQIRRWWQQNPNALIGVPTGAASGICVLDLDLRTEHSTGQIVTDGSASLRSLIKDNSFDPLPETWIVQTPSGGQHLYFFHEEGFRSSAGKIAPGIDTRAEGGYVIFPPSPGYTLRHRKTPADAPPWLAELFRNPHLSVGRSSHPPVTPTPHLKTKASSVRLDRAAYVSAALLREAEAVALAPEGTRNTSLNAAAFKMGQYVGLHNLEEGEVYEKLLSAAIQCGLSDAEARSTIASGLRGGMKTPKEPPPEAHQPDAVFELAPHTGSVVSVSGAVNAGYLPRRTKPSKPYEGEFMPAEKLFDPWTTYTAPEFPLQVFPSLVRTFIAEYSLDTGASQSALAMSCMAALSGAISHETRLRLSSSFDVGPRLWVLIVGRSSAKKTPAQGAAVKPLFEIQDELRDEHRQRIALLKKSGASEEEIEAAKADEPPRLIIHETTTERLQILLCRQNRGVLMHCDELASLLGAMDRYSKGGSGGDKAFYLQAYNGGSYSALRLTTPDRDIQRLSVSILGGIQPKRMSKLMNLADDGFLQRFLPVTIGQMPVREARDVTEAAAGWSAQVKGIFKTTRNGGWVTLSEAAGAEFRAFEKEIEYLATGDVIDSILEEFVGKLPGVWGTMCLILHLLHGGGVSPDVAFANDDNAVVSGSVAQLASSLMREFVMPHGWLFYSNVGEETRQHLQAIGAHIVGLQQNNKTVATARDFQRGPACFKGMQAKDVAAKILPFIIGGWLEPADISDACRSWHINPAVAMFTERAAKQRELAAEMLRRLTPPTPSGPGRLKNRDTSE